MGTKYPTGKEQIVPPIKDGTVIDHQTSHTVCKAVRILDLENQNNDYISSTATNLKSKKVPGGRKDILKIENRELDPVEVDKIALLSPYATINIIRDYDVVDKRRVELPDELVGIVRCPNPSCISNPRVYDDGTIRKEPIDYKFKVIDKKKPKIKCYYCGREPENIEEFIL